MAKIAQTIEPSGFLMCNTSNIEQMRCGRPQTVMFEAGANGVPADGVLPNGTIVTLKDTMEATDKILDHVHAIQLEAQTAVIGKYIMVAPEINVQQYRRIDNCVAKFALEEKETYTAYELQKHDRIEYSEAYLAVPGVIPGVGDLLDIDANGKLVAGGACLRVVSVRKQRLPMMMAADQGAAGVQGVVLMPEAVNFIKVEVIA